MPWKAAPVTSRDNSWKHVLTLIAVAIGQCGEALHRIADAMDKDARTVPPEAPAFNETQTPEEAP